MKSVAFCPAHITGFFKAELDNQSVPELVGSTGAGFSIRDGVTTTVKLSPKKNSESYFAITTDGYQTNNTDVSEFVLNEFLQLGNFENYFFDIKHEIAIPIGYGLGSSSAVALSLSYALNNALETNLSSEKIGQIAHKAEIHCKTGLGDVIGSYYGGFEIRTKAGAPGYGIIEKISSDPLCVMMICFSPISTKEFIKERLPQINGLGGKMVRKLLQTRDYNQFQDMSLEFARYAKVMTPDMEDVIQDLSNINIKCGVALCGETIFTMVSSEKEKQVMEIFEKYPKGIIIKSELDEIGARLIVN